MTFVAATLGLVLAVVATIHSAKKHSTFLFFWVFSILFFFLPVFVDVFAISVLNSSSYFDALITSRYLGQANKLADAPYLKMLIIALSFSVAFLVVQLLLSKRGINDSKIYLSPFSAKAMFIFAIIDVLALLVFILFNNKIWFSPSLFVPQSPIAYRASFLIVLLSALLIPALHQRRFFLFAIFLLCPIIVSLGTSQRPWALAGLGSLLFYFIATQEIGRISVKKIIVVCILGFTTIAILRAVRHGFDGSLAEMAFSRDASYFSALYVFAEEEIFAGITGGSALLFLLQSGWVPEALRVGSYSNVNIPFFIAEEQMGWSRGSMHPTIFAWAYVDLGNIAFISGAVFSASFALIEKAISRIDAKCLVFLVPATVFAYSTMVRGTVQRGWSNFVFMAFLIIVIAIIFNLMRNRGIASNHSKYH